MWSSIGFEKQKKHFQTLFTEGRLSHAYLLAGPGMIGKRQFALDLFRLINGRTDLPDRQAGLAIHRDPDIKYVAPAATDPDQVNFITYAPPKKERSGQEIYVEDIQGGRAFLSISAMYGPYKYLLINDAERLNAEASNALLKILEEPPPSSIFLLVSSRPDMMLPTIASRCQEIKFLPHESSVIHDYLQKHRFSKEEEELITLLAGGRLGWVVRLVESHGIHDLRKIIDEFQAVLKKGTFDRMQYAKRIFESEEYPQLIDIWIRWVRAYGKNPAKTAKVVKDLIRLNDLISKPEMNHRLALENFLIGI